LGSILSICVAEYAFGLVAYNLLLHWHDFSDTSLDQNSKTLSIKWTDCSLERPNTHNWKDWMIANFWVTSHNRTKLKKLDKVAALKVIVERRLFKLQKAKAKAYKLFLVAI
jgi:hypothetical protein